MHHPKTRATCLKVLEKDIQKELTKVASKKSGSSCLHQKTLGALQSFTWEKLHQELKSKAPTFYRVLIGCVNVHRRKQTDKTSLPKTHCPGNSIVLGMCAALLLWHRNQHLNLVQRIISLILYSGHTGKQVLLFCLFCVHFVIDSFTNSRSTNLSKKYYPVFPMNFDYSGWTGWESRWAGIAVFEPHFTL